jgi:hypothetical protein
MAGCGITDPCENTPIIEVPSTDRSVSAWVFIRDCGATTAKSTQVSILAAGDGPPQEAGNAFIVGGETQVIATWREPARVDISFEPRAEIFKQQSSVLGVTISYQSE